MWPWLQFNEERKNWEERGSRQKEKDEQKRNGECKEGKNKKDWKKT